MLDLICWCSKSLSYFGRYASPPRTKICARLILRYGRVARSRGEYAPGDLNESFMIGPVDVGQDAYYVSPAAGKHFAPNLWPKRPEALREIYTTYFWTMSDLARTLMRLFALALDQPETYFDEKIDKHISRLRVRNYPCRRCPRNWDSSGPAPTATMVA